MLHIDAVVILVWIARWRIKRVMIDTGSSTHFLFNHYYEQIKYKLEPRLKSYDCDLYGFNGKPVKSRGIIKLPVDLGDGANYVTCDIEFLVVDFLSPYNAILGKTS